MEIGYNEEIPHENPKLGAKHYRRYYNDELENIKEIFKKPAFLNIDVIRG